MADPLQHVARQPLPWQIDDGLTECGRPLNDVASVCTRDEMVVKVKREGQARAGLTSCMTCWQTADRWPTFDVDPTNAVTRVYAGYRPDKIRERELRAIAELVGRHRDEFNAIMQGLDEATDLAAVRTARRSVVRRG